MNIDIPCWCITHKTISYIGAPTVPTNLPGGDAMPLFLKRELVDIAIASTGDMASKLLPEELPNPVEFVGFLKMVNGLGIQYVAVNPVVGEQCKNIYKIGVMLAQFESGPGREWLDSHR